MLSITELRKGTLIQLDGQPFRVVEYSQKVMGRGGSIVTIRAKNLIDGTVQERTLKGNEKVQPADVTNSQVQYLYRDDTDFYFMDDRTYDQFSLSERVVGDSANYLKEGMTVTAQHFNGQTVAVELPIKVPLTVVEADPGVKGDTVSNVMKNASLESGVTIQVPLFVNPGDTIIVDTRDGSYVERAR